MLKRLFNIPERETSFERRGFRGGSPVTRARLERVGSAFVAGYRAVMEDSCAEALVPKLEATPHDFRGFAYEGAAMGLALLDWLTPWRRGRVDGLLQGAGEPHAYMVHVGAGWVLARVPGRVEGFLDRFDPLLRWLVVDGYGFHEAFFRWARYLAGQPAPRRLRGYARRVFDQGFGRCLWFVEGGEVWRITETLSSFDPERRGDLWSGVGLACVYAGNATPDDLRVLREAAGEFRPHLAQGAAFAAKARHRAGNLMPYQDTACRVLCGLDAVAAAAVTDAALENLPSDGAEPAYEIWRLRIQRKFTPGPAECSSSEEGGPDSGRIAACASPAPPS